ncbi:MAG: hypothetical protein ABIR47_00745 [Candidatus Kapaibacterium sp.]
MNIIATIVFPSICFMVLMIGCGTSTEPQIPSIPTIGIYSGTFSISYHPALIDTTFDVAGSITFDTHGESSWLARLRENEQDLNLELMEVGTWSVQSTNGKDSIDLEDDSDVPAYLSGLKLEGNYAYSYTGTTLRIWRTKNEVVTDIVMQKQ